jgi:hypothetical protein
MGRGLWGPNRKSERVSGRLNLRHFTAKRRTPSTFLRAVSAKRMMRYMAFAGLCTCVAYLSTKCTDLFCQWGEAAHPLCRKGTHVSAFTTHPNTEGHQLRIIVLHADHVIAAGIAYCRTGPTGRDAILILSCQLSIVSMHCYLLLKTI